MYSSFGENMDPRILARGICGGAREGIDAISRIRIDMV